ncbi:MAG: PSD1 and planctomycete cytochrome C domain-containing protein [Verrucomicrobiota bacterium]
MFFETAIAPILKQHCSDCHNPDKRKGELDLSTTESLMRGGESGAVFKAGEPEQSHLYELTHKGEMPKKGDKLSHQQVETIRHWIEGGARFQNPPKIAEKKLNQHDVLPIVLLRCTVCHGPRRQDGGLDLRTPAAMLKGGENGPALIVGKPDDSLMIRRIESQACPPRDLLLKYFVKRPPSSETKTLRDWISAGAPVVDIAPDVATTAGDPLVSADDRQHWAFIKSKAKPGAKSIDEFILSKLKQKGLSFSSEANRDTLIRRAYIDLVGLPPDLAEWQKWRSDKNPDWYKKMIDHLLASPHYGERWGRYWLDLAGYANSEGGVSADTIRQVAWKYRDYVIKSFNQDKAYDRFLLEQIAGDELIDYENASVITDEMVDNLVATGFLRMGIDQTGSRTMNFVPERLGVIGDAINVLGSGIMSLTLECARCHTHKYDPIPQRDYYRLKAVFQGAFDEHDWMSFKTRSLNVATLEHKKRISEINPAYQAQLKKLKSRQIKAVRKAQLTLMRQHFPDQSEADRKETIIALKKADNQRTRTQAILVEKYLRADLLPDSDQPEAVLSARQLLQEVARDIGRVEGRMEAPVAIRALWDRGQPSPTYILRRGEYNKPGRLVGPGVPTALTDGHTPFVVEQPFPNGTSKTGRRLAFARWLTQADHPLTSRVMVNRIWKHHFGIGLVKSLENFGVQGEKPSHPELLDWLAVQFVESGWSIKEVHRLLMNSQSYKQSSIISDERLTLDPQNRLISRMPMRRMNAEALRDSLLFVSGKLEDRPGGPPDRVTAKRDGLVVVNESAKGGWRRSIYLQYRRTEIPTMMDTFDYPEMGPNCIARNISTVSPQSLMLMNNQHVRDLAAAFAARINKSLGKRNNDPGAQVTAVYHLALSRPPSEEELRLGTATLKDLTLDWQGDKNGPLVTYCHTLLNSAAFLYID